MHIVLSQVPGASLASSLLRNLRSPILTKTRASPLYPSQLAALACPQWLGLWLPEKEGPLGLHHPAESGFLHQITRVSFICEL